MPEGAYPIGTIEKPPLDLHIEVTGADGIRTRWDSEDLDPQMRPTGITFGTQRMAGFANGGVTLSRRIDQDYYDIGLYDNLVFVGYDGSIAYEGRISAQPRSFEQQHTIEIQAAGWVSHLSDRKFTDIYVDRDLSQWKDASMSWRVANMAVSPNPIYNKTAPSVLQDATNYCQVLLLSVQDHWETPIIPGCSAQYDAGPGNAVGFFYCWWNQGANVTFAAPWAHRLYRADDDGQTVWSTVINNTEADQMKARGHTHYMSLDVARYLTAEFRYDATPAGNDGYSYEIRLGDLAVFKHARFLHYSTPPGGVYASEVIADIIANYASLLDTSGIQNTSYIIEHLTFRDRVTPYDAILQINKYHLWQFGVWEHKRFFFEPADMTKADWEVRMADEGVSLSLQGDSTEAIANGITVSFFDVDTGRQNLLTPDEYDELVDSDPNNPATRAGLRVWTDIAVSAPTTVSGAIGIGQAALAEYNLPKAPGTIRVTGHVRSGASKQWEQVWKVRAGQTIAITDFPNDRPRLIEETSYDHDSQTITITVEGQPHRMDAVFDRIETALVANGLLNR